MSEGVASAWPLVLTQCRGGLVHHAAMSTSKVGTDRASSLRVRVRDTGVVHEHVRDALYCLSMCARCVSRWHRACRSNLRTIDSTAASRYCRRAASLPAGHTVRHSSGTAQEVAQSWTTVARKGSCIGLGSRVRAPQASNKYSP